MPRNINQVEPLEEVSLEARRLAPDYCQEHWYQLASLLCTNQTVLDVGAGTGYGLDILREAKANYAMGMDLQPLRPDIYPIQLTNFSEGSFDILTAMDVIEHVEEDHLFLQQMLRVARKAVILSTPNYATWKCTNPHHVREYTPEELEQVLLQCQCYAGLIYTCGVNRVLHPVKEIMALDEAKDFFSIVLRSPHATDADWDKIKSLLITDTLTQHLVLPPFHLLWHDEWVSLAKMECQEDEHKLLDWVHSQLSKGEGPYKEYDPVLILRQGKATHLQRCIVFSWLLEIVLGKPSTIMQTIINGESDYQVISCTEAIYNIESKQIYRKVVVTTPPAKAGGF